MIREFIIGAMALMVIFATPLYAEVFCSFQGHYSASEGKVHISTQFKDQSVIEGEMATTGPEAFRLSGKMDHVKTPLFEISSMIDCNFEAVKNENQNGEYVRGTVASKYSLINAKPVRELTGRFEIRDNRIFLTPLSWAGIECSGYIGLISPFEMSVSLKIAEVAADEIPIVSSYKNNDSSIAGAFSGRIELSGFVDHLMIRGRLTSVDGRFRSIEYSKLYLNFEGLYPNVHIADSTAIDNEGLSFHMEGDLDLAKEGNLLAGLTSLNMSPAIGETDISREWTIKRKQDSESSATEFKYRLKKPESDSEATKEETDMLTIGHNIKF